MRESNGSSVVAVLEFEEAVGDFWGADIWGSFWFESSCGSVVGGRHD